jgi:non-haem Fe2+, alpha-ketoglutarate-dependent halogenase
VLTGACDPSEIQSWVISACQELGLPAQSPKDDFFEIGGTSLSAIKMITKAEREFGEDALSPDDLFERSILHEIAESISRGRPGR